MFGAWLHEEDGGLKGEGEPPSAALIWLILNLLKHLMLFSVDNVEEDGVLPKRDENRRSANVTRVYFLSIEEIESLGCAGTLLNRACIMLQTCARVCFNSFTVVDVFCHFSIFVSRLDMECVRSFL